MGSPAVAIGPGWVGAASKPGLVPVEELKIWGRSSNTGSFNGTNFASSTAIISGGMDLPPCPPPSLVPPALVIGKKRNVAKETTTAGNPACVLLSVGNFFFFNFSQFYTQVPSTQCTWILISIRYWGLALKIKVELWYGISGLPYSMFKQIK